MSTPPSDESEYLRTLSFAELLRRFPDPPKSAPQQRIQRKGSLRAPFIGMTRPGSVHLEGQPARRDGSPTSAGSMSSVSGNASPLIESRRAAGSISGAGLRSSQTNIAIGAASSRGSVGPLPAGVASAGSIGSSSPISGGISGSTSSSGSFIPSSSPGGPLPPAVAALRHEPGGGGGGGGGSRSGSPAVIQRRGSAVQPVESSAKYPSTASFPQAQLVRAVKCEATPAELQSVVQALQEAPRSVLLAVLPRAYEEAAVARSGGGSLTNSRKVNETTSLSTSKKTNETLSASTSSIGSGSGGESSGGGGGIDRTKLPLVTLSRTLVEFGGGVRSIAMEKDVAEEVEFRLDSEKKVKWTLRPPACPAGSSWAVGATPLTGKLEKKAPTCKVMVTVHVRAAMKVSQVVVLEVEKGLRYFLVVRASTEPSLFGTELSTLELVQEEAWRVPPCLVTMKRLLYELGAFHREGIFRVTPPEEEIEPLRAMINRGQPLRSSDPHAVATLLKHFYRDLPNPVLADVPTTIFMAQSLEPDDREIKTAMNRMREPNRSAFEWYIDLMAETAMYEVHNKMGAKSLATCTSPNLYNSPQIVLNPADSLQVTQKIANFVTRLIVLRMHARRQAAAAAAAAAAAQTASMGGNSIGGGSPMGVGSAPYHSPMPGSSPAMSRQ